MLDEVEAEEMQPNGDPLTNSQSVAEWDFENILPVNNINNVNIPTEHTKNNQNITLIEIESDNDEVPLTMIKKKPKASRENDGDSTGSSLMSLKEDTPRYDFVTKIPIVYTTRLEDMKVFDQIRINKKSYIKKIIFESKPNIKSYSVNRPRLDRHNVTPFDDFVRKIYNINIKLRRAHKTANKANDKVIKPLNNIDCIGNLNERTKDLLNICKPLTISLESLKDNKVKKPLKTKTTAITKDSFSKCCLLKAPSALFWKKLRIELINILLLIMNEKTNTIEMYLVNGYGCVMEYYRKTVTETDIHIILRQYGLHNKFHHTIANICCWYKRNEVLMTFFSTIELCIQNFLKTRHNCMASTNCTCCCKPLTNFNRQHNKSDSIISDVSAYINIHKSLRPLYNNIESHFINTALLFTPKPEDHRRGSLALNSANTGKYLRNANIQIKSIRTNVKDCYELGANGEVKTYRQTNDAASFIPEKIIYSFTFCCWYRRETILMKLATMKVSPNALLFMKTAHTCYLQLCVCCCKFSNKEAKRKPNIKMNSPHSSLHSSSNKITIVRIKFNIKTVKAYIKSPTFKGPSNTPLKTNTSPIIDLSETNSTAHKINVISNSNSDYTINLKEMSPKPVNDKKYSSFQLYKTNNKGVKPVIDSRSDLRLEATNKGVLTLSTNTSNAELSNSDVERSNITSEAQKSLNKLKITPGITIKKKSNIDVPSSLPSKVKAESSIYNDLNKDVEKEMFNIIPQNVANNIPSQNDNKIFTNLTKLQYANKIHSLSAFSQLKKEMIALHRNKSSSNNDICKKSLSKNKPLPNTLDKMKENELGPVNRLMHRLAGKITVRVSQQTANQKTVQPPDHEDFSMPPPESKVENIYDEKIEIYTHKVMKRNINMAEQIGKKRHRLENNQSEIDGVNNLNTTPNDFQCEPSTSHISIRSKKQEGNITKGKMSGKRVIRSSLPAEVTDLSGLHPITHISTVIKEESPTPEESILPDHEMEDFETLKKQSDDSILGI